MRLEVKRHKGFAVGNIDASPINGTRYWTQLRRRRPGGGERLSVRWHIGAPLANDTREINLSAH